MHSFCTIKREGKGDREGRGRRVWREGGEMGERETGHRRYQDFYCRSAQISVVSFQVGVLKGM